VRRVIRRSGKPLVQSLFDSVDFSQDVWREFFSKSIRRYEFSTPDDLLAFLSDITKKCVYAKLRQIGSKISDCDTLPIDTLTSYDSRPEDIAAAQEAWDRFLSSLPSSRDRDILRRFVAGESKEDIARRVGISLRTVNRLLQRAGDVFE